LKIFEFLYHLTTFERRNFGAIETMEDLDIVVLIGLHQCRGRIVTLKDIQASKIGAAATIERRLSRFKRLGIVAAKRSRKDGRNIELSLSPATMRVFQRYAKTLAGLGQIFESA